MTKIDYQENKKIIESFYTRLERQNDFEKDNEYLESAFKRINDIWIDNFNKIEKVKYLMIAEAPLWGKGEKYIYNPYTNNTQFFYRSDLEETLKIKIRNKKNFIQTCNKIGLLIIDISPFPLNTKDTKINYGKNQNGSKKLTKNEYRNLVSETIPLFFEQKIKLIKKKKSNDLKIFFRYARVKNIFQDLIEPVLIENELIKSKNELGDISQNGGGVNKLELKQIFKNEKSLNH
ncbi:MAG: hypothetical protein RBR87_09520 [Bacteroidales bacterium]|jgi:hypothetical protein|nr:hypothetical protein [Bacteroidales bacterium]